MLHGPRRQAEPLLKFQNVLPKSLRCEPMLSGVVTKAGQIEFRDTRRIDQDINGEIAILRPSEFIDKIADGTQRGARLIVHFKGQRGAQLFELPVFGAVPDQLGDGIARRPAGWNSATGAPVGANGLRESMNTGHDFLSTSMRRQMRSGEAVAVNTPADRCSSVSLDVIKSTPKSAPSEGPETLSLPALL